MDLSEITVENYNFNSIFVIVNQIVFDNILVGSPVEFMIPHERSVFHVILLIPSSIDHKLLSFHSN